MTLTISITYLFKAQLLLWLRYIIKPLRYLINLISLIDINKVKNKKTNLHLYNCLEGYEIIIILIKKVGKITLVK